MDKSLDEIISSRPKGPRRSARRGGAKAAAIGASGPATSASARARVTNSQATGPTPQPSEKIIVSNLPNDVNEAQIKELFSSTVGPLKEVNLHFDANGRSKGVAQVVFSRKGDGAKAHQQYNNRLIDGKRPMKVEMVLEMRAPTLAQRVAPVGGAAKEGAEVARNGAGTKPRRGGRRVGAGRKKEEKPKTAADLDAEMEDYTANPPAAAA